MTDGLTALRVDSWEERAGSTSAEVFRHMRGQGIAPRTKAHLFYLAFELLGLHRVATVCRVSNLASRRSIAKTAGLRLEGVMRESGVNEQGEFEDECPDPADCPADCLRCCRRAQFCD